jgi:hypothetical protein
MNLKKLKSNLYIQFLEGQGLGNQLWIYYVAYSISKKNNLNLIIVDLKKFKGNSFINLINDGLLNKLPLSVKIIHEDTYFDVDLNMYVSTYDKKIYSIKKDSLLVGNLQSEKYLINNLTFNLRNDNEILFIKNILRKKINKSNVCVINIRGGEYKYHKNLLLPINYWLNAIKLMKKINKDMKFIIATDDPSYSKSLFPDYEIISGIEKSFISLLFCQNAILSNSSFSYFPLKFNKNLKKNIIAPFNWARFGNKFKRWASPCNVYKGWLWLNDDGILYNYSQALKFAHKTKIFYEKNYTINIPKIRKKTLFDLLKTLLKKFLHFVNPIKF